MFGTKDRCYRGGKQHKYEARYDEESKLPTDLQLGDFKVGALNLPGSPRDTKKTYVHDICVWCGDIKKRSDA
jgi:hypothetical protein